MSYPRDISNAVIETRIPYKRFIAPHTGSDLEKAASHCAKQLNLERDARKRVTDALTKFMTEIQDLKLVEGAAFLKYSSSPSSTTLIIEVLMQEMGNQASSKARHAVARARTALRDHLRPELHSNLRFVNTAQMESETVELLEAELRKSWTGDLSEEPLASIFFVQGEQISA